MLPPVQQTCFVDLDGLCPSCFVGVMWSTVEAYVVGVSRAAASCELATIMFGNILYVLLSYSCIGLDHSDI